MGLKVAIIDDEIHIRSLLEQTLEELEEEFGVEMFLAANGREGLELIVREAPQLVFCDVMMPEMNGYDVCRSVREQGLDTIKIILLTAKGQEIDRQQGLDAGAFDYVTKPFDPDDLIQRAKEILGLK
ncbi:MAG: response regulator [Rhodospirillales bacterium]|nr:MAG: response regulator [Rhodospirillales bacterium]